MTRGVNKVILIGQLGNDPEVKATSNGSFISNLTLATNESWKDKEGNQQERTEWHRVVLYGKIAELSGQYLKKGSKVYVEGKLQTRKWVDQNNVDRYTTEVVVDQFNGNVQFLDSRPTNSGNAGNGQPVQNNNQPAKQPAPAPAANKQATPEPAQQPVQNQNPTPVDDPFDDDIPF